MTTMDTNAMYLISFYLALYLLELTALDIILKLVNDHRHLVLNPRKHMTALNLYPYQYSILLNAIYVC